MSCSPIDENRNGIIYRQCNKCKEFKELSSSNYRVRKKNIGHFCYTCIECNQKECHLSEEEIKARDELNKYILTTFFKYYEEERPLPQYFWIRINGIITGTFASNNKKIVSSKNQYKFILLLFKYSEKDIKKCINNMSFNNDAHLINTICKIAQNNYYTFLKKLQFMQKTQSKFEKNIETIQPSISQEKVDWDITNKKEDSEYEDLW